MIDWFKQKLTKIRLYFSKSEFYTTSDIFDNLADNSITDDRLVDNYITTPKMDPNAVVGAIRCSSCGSFASPNSACIICGHVNERNN